MASESVMKLGFLLSATDKMSRVIDEAVKKSTDKLNAFERTTAQIGKGVMKVGGLMTGAGVAIGTAMFASAKSVGEYGDQITNAAQKTGIGVVDLQKLSYAAERNNVNFESFSGAITKLNKNIVDFRVKGDKATTIFKDLGIRTDNVKNTLLDTAKVFAKAKDGPGKAAAAMELFGKAGADLIPFLNQGEEGITNLMQEAERMGLVLSEDAIKEANNFNTVLGNLKNTVTGESRQIGSLLIPYVEKAVLKIQEIINKVVAWAQANPNLIKTIVKFVAGLTGFLLIAGPIITAIGATIAITGKLVGIVRTVVTVVKAVNAALWTLAANPVVLIIAAIVAAVVGLVFGFRYLWKNCEGFRNFWIELWDRVKESVGKAIAFIKEVWEGLKPVADAVFSAIQNVIQIVFGWIKDFWDKWGNDIKEFFVATFGFIWKIIRPPLMLIGAIIKGVFLSIKWVVVSIFNGIIAFWERWGGIITNIFSKAFGVVKAIFKTVFDWILGVMRVFTKVFQGDWAGAWQAVKDLFMNTWENIKKVFVAVWDYIKAVFEGAWEGIKAIFQAINPVPWLAGIWDSFSSWFTGLKDSFFGWGRSIIQGLIDGVMAMFSKVKDAISNIGGAIKDKFKGLLGISSPSKVFAEYGLNITQGLTGGMASGEAATGRAAEGLAMQTVRAAGNDVGATTTNVSNIDNSAFGGVTLNYSPVVTVTGGGGASAGEDIMKVLQRHKSEVARLLQEIVEGNRRVAFAMG